jgi:predicted site-specific integrase-resolvase
MKLSDYAKSVGVTYRTAWQWFKSGKINGYQMPTGTIIINENNTEQKQQRVVAVYARVSSSENRNNLDSQAERLVCYCEAKGWQISRVIKEVGSGVNDGRKLFLSLLADPTVTHIVVEHKDRATRFGFSYIDTLLKQCGRSIEVVNLAEDGKADLVDDLVAVIYSFSARMYGQRRAKRKTEQIIRHLQHGNEEPG